MSSPHRSRRLALQALCCIDAQGPNVWPLLEAFVRNTKESSATVEVALRMSRGALDDLAACDEILARHARRWELHRLALVDRNILRLAVYELRKDETPLKVILSEALRLAREFSTAESPRFVNGVLDAAARELRIEHDTPHDPDTPTDEAPDTDPPPEEAPDETGASPGI